jgi:hypothetical protein
MAVGESFNSRPLVNGQKLAERWNGSGWAIQPTPDPRGALASGLNAVSCTKATICTAVGGYAGHDNGYTLAERWNGRSWAIQPTANTTSHANALLSVSCATSNACTAVGIHGLLAQGPTVSALTFAERWNGTRWAIQPTVDPADVLTCETERGCYSVLDSVACPSTNECTAVGSYVDSSGVEFPLAEHWNGSSWVIQATPEQPQNPSFGGGGGLVAVSCPKSDDCTAVGSYLDEVAASTQVLMEHWNGSTWAVQAGPRIPGTVVAVLSAVSCVKAADCSAVGAVFNATSGAERTLAEHWNGSTWAIQPTPNSKGVPQSSLLDVSCPKTAACTAVGGYSTDITVASLFPLAERYS